MFLVLDEAIHQFLAMALPDVQATPPLLPSLRQISVTICYFMLPPFLPNKLCLKSLLINKLSSRGTNITI